MKNDQSGASEAAAEAVETSIVAKRAVSTVATSSQTLLASLPCAIVGDDDVPTACHITATESAYSASALEQQHHSLQNNAAAGVERQIVGQFDATMANNSMEGITNKKEQHHHFTSQEIHPQHQQLEQYSSTLEKENETALSDNNTKTKTKQNQKDETTEKESFFPPQKSKNDQQIKKREWLNWKLLKRIDHAHMSSKDGFSCSSVPAAAVAVVVVPPLAFGSNKPFPVTTSEKSTIATECNTIFPVGFYEMTCKKRGVTKGRGEWKHKETLVLLHCTAEKAGCKFKARFCRVDGGMEVWISGVHDVSKHSIPPKRGLSPNARAYVTKNHTLSQKRLMHLMRQKGLIENDADLKKITQQIKRRKLTVSNHKKQCGSGSGDNVGGGYGSSCGNYVDGKLSTTAWIMDHNNSVENIGSAAVMFQEMKGGSSSLSTTTTSSSSSSIVPPANHVSTVVATSCPTPSLQIPLHQQPLHHHNHHHHSVHAGSVSIVDGDSDGASSNTVSTSALSPIQHASQQYQQPNQQPATFPMIFPNTATTLAPVHDIPAESEVISPTIDHNNHHHHHNSLSVDMPLGNSESGCGNVIVAAQSSSSILDRMEENDVSAAAVIDKAMAQAIKCSGAEQQHFLHQEDMITDIKQTHEDTWRSGIIDRPSSSAMHHHDDDVGLYASPTAAAAAASCGGSNNDNGGVISDDGIDENIGLLQSIDTTLHSLGD